MTSAGNVGSRQLVFACGFSSLRISNSQYKRQTAFNLATINY